MKKIASEEDFVKAVASEEFVLFVHADWAEPSRQLMEEMQGFAVLPLFVLDVVELPHLVVDFNVKAVPTLLWIKAGKVLKWQSGFVAGQTLDTLFEVGDTDG